MDTKYGQCSPEHFQNKILAKISIHDNRVDLLPVYYSSPYFNDYFGFYTDPQFTFIGNGKIVFNFPIESNIYLYEMSPSKTTAYGGKPTMATSTAPSLPLSACNEDDKKLTHFIENIFYCKVIYDPYRHFFYRLHLGEAKGKKIDGSFKNVNDKVQYLTVLNEKFEVLKEIVLEDRRYLLQGAFVAKEGLYLNAPFSEDYLQFKIFQISTK